MNPLILRARLYILGAGLLVLLGGIIFAVARWNQAATDRAFVDAARRAGAAAATAAPPRFWMPVGPARPGAAVIAEVEAIERARSMPGAAARPEAATKPPAAGP